jgi:hypothetical protein
MLPTQEVEIRKIAVQSHPRDIVHETLSRKNLTQKIAGGVAFVFCLVIVTGELIFNMKLFFFLKYQAVFEVFPCKKL